MDAMKTLIDPAGQEYFLRPDVVFLNHGSYGARPRPVFEEYQRWQRQLEYEPVAFLGRQIADLLRVARTPLAAYVGADVDDLVFVPNATHGMNIVARSLRLGPGDEILLNDHEYGAVARTWRFLCGQSGATLRIQPITLPLMTEDDLIEQLWQGVTPQTRVLVVSHITSPTAIRFPVTAICQWARAAGIITIVDGAHAPGQIDLDLAAIGADFYLGNCHKWLSASVGAGFLYARKERQEQLQPLVVSWGYESLTPSNSRFQDLFGWLGTDDPAAYLSVPAAIAFQEQHNWSRVRAACHDLARATFARISELTGLPPVVPDTWWTQLCAIPLPVRADITAQEFQRILFEQYHIEIPIIDWEGHRFVRLSLQAYNSTQDVDALVHALKQML